MNKEQIKKFWDDHKEGIIGGALILGSIAIIGVSVISASKASQKALIAQERSEIAKAAFETDWALYKKELIDVGAEFRTDGKWELPDATKEVAIKFLDRGDNYKLDIFNDHEAVVWITR